VYIFSPQGAKIDTKGEHSLILIKCTISYCLITNEVLVMHLVHQLDRKKESVWQNRVRIVNTTFMYRGEQKAFSHFLCYSSQGE
jgi:hypothetical protein